MLARIGVREIDELVRRCAGRQAHARAPPICRARKGEIEVERALAALADGTLPRRGAVLRWLRPPTSTTSTASVDHLISAPSSSPPTTPYQPGIAQGTLQYLFEFQTQVALLTGMEVANASMYDGSTAAAEAVLMAHRITRRRKALIAGNLHPHYRETIATVSRLAGDEVAELPPAPAGREDMAIDDTVSCVVVQTPDFSHIAYLSLTEISDVQDLPSDERRTRGSARC